MSYRQPFSGNYPISQYFGETITDKNGHTGIDYACPLTTQILASADGQVFYAGWKDGGYGYCVFIKHADGNVTIYEHLLSQICVNVGQVVKQGQVIGYSGSTGKSTGPHLHFEVRDSNGKPFDPMKLGLVCVDDNISYVKPEPKKLKEPDELGEKVKITAPAGAWAWNESFSKRDTVYAYGTKLNFTGKTIKRNEYTYCEVYPEPVKYWVAVHDRDCQILDNDVQA